MDIDTEARVHTITQSSKGEQRTLKNVKLFGKTVLTVTLGFWLAVLIIATVGIIPLTQLIVGIVHKNACPMNHLIPIYLIVAGVIGLILVTISILQNVSEKDNCCLCLNLILSILSLAWLITGSVLVFRAKSTVQFNNPDIINTYCHHIVFNCAHVTIIITYVLLGFATCC